MPDYDGLARLFDYPSEDYQRHAGSCGEGLAGFAREIEPLSTSELQELFIRTFDWNPDCCLEVGWHLFGENYDRGEFLVKMRQELRRHGLRESTELPDHLKHVLPLLGRMEGEEAAKFSHEFVQPALAKMLAGLEGKKNPFEKLLRHVSLETS